LQSTGTAACRYALRIQRTAGNTSTGGIFLDQTLESANSKVYAGQQVTFSGWIRRGANFSASSNVVVMRILSGTGTDERVASGFTGQATVISQNKTLTTTWQRFSVTGTVATTATQLAVVVSYTPVGTAGADDWFEITGAQLEIGAVPSTFQMNGESVAAELANCQRYFRRFGFGTSSNIVVMGAGSGTTTTNFFKPLYPPMRIAPTSIAWTAIQMRDGTGASTAITGLSLVNGSPTSTCIQATHALNDTAHRPYCLDTTSTTGYIELNAEV
jgi:hypothetical protein